MLLPIQTGECEIFNQKCCVSPGAPSWNDFSIHVGTLAQLSYNVIVGTGMV